MASSPGQTTLPPNALTSTEKKRIRDRRAQKMLRERRNNLLRELEEQVTHCVKNHGPTTIEKLMEKLNKQQEEIESLRGRQQKLEDEVSTLTSPEVVHSLQTPEMSDDAHERPTLGSLPSAVEAVPNCLISTVPKSGDLGLFLAPRDQLPPHDHRTLRLPPAGLVWDLESPEDAEPLPELVPAWALVPSDLLLSPELTLATCAWFARPDIVAAAPSVPSALHLMYGSRSNELANTIYVSIQQLNVRPPEALAMGWLVYVYAKWRVDRSAESFARLPVFMRPTLAQVQHLHVSCIDHLVFPRIRANLVRHCGCDIDKAKAVFALLSCCLKVRWKWGEPIVEPDENDRIQVRESFYNTFMSIQGWGITSEFIDTYPEMVEGMDISSLRYTLL
ncbi:hypothetical protein BDV39DRAFT_168762 [Aspergillus sergii]|uniref:BZIP transcription factor n=1 Tax=Aspergillus sergii TaxID=1034303 RepID=A0A5N6XIP4_9EURO|nr:hypothetical protein BDV39DRAFT_168762 [Aspergillus sergii]